MISRGRSVLTNGQFTNQSVKTEHFLHPWSHDSRSTRDPVRIELMNGVHLVCVLNFGLPVTSGQIKSLKYKQCIPPCFMKKISGELSDKATLKGPSGRCWNVKLNFTKDSSYLQDGWQEFQRDHSLGDNEFLLFRYDGDMHFNVQIFDKSGVEKRDITTISQKHHQSASSDGKRKRGRPRKHPIPLEYGEDGSGQHLRSLESSKLRKIKEKVIDPTSPEMNSQSMKIKENIDTQKELSGEFVGSSSQNMDADSEVQPQNGAARVQKEANAFTSSYPYFKISLTKACVHKVHIMTVPWDFSRAHFPQFETRMVLRNAKGKSWVVNCISAANKHFFCGGWESFVSDNNLKENDLCIFELVGKHKMQVHIFQSD